jgi:aspartyl-tRNA(Asn)/glutamyl-tRNA(Gln) amidotransferase subunit A
MTSIAVTQAHLDRIAEVDGQVHAFVHVDAEGALEQARPPTGAGRPGRRGRRSTACRSRSTT